MWSRLSSYFFNGLVVLLPLFVTVYLLRLMFSFADGFLGEFIGLMAGRTIPGVGFLASIFLILFTGFLAAHVFGEKLIQLAERLLFRVPIVKGIYGAAKQVNDVLFQKEGKSEFRRPCVIEYPRSGIYSIGFMTSEVAEELGLGDLGDLVNIFIPNTPTPATGFLIMVPKKDIKPLAIGFDEAFRLVVSAGVLKPRSGPIQKDN